MRGSPKQLWATVGDWPATKPEAAREAAQEIRAAAALGRDLVEERRAALRASVETARQRVPVAGLLDQWRAETERQAEAKKARGEGARYERELLLVERNRLRPALRGLSAADVDGERLQALIDRQPSRATANYLRALIVRVARFVNAELAGTGVRWPTRFEVNGRPRSRDHRFTIEEMRRLWDAAGGLGRRGALVRFMMLTGCRRGEAQKVSGTTSSSTTRSSARTGRSRRILPRTASRTGCRSPPRPSRCCAGCRLVLAVRWSSRAGAGV